MTPRVAMKAVEERLHGFLRGLLRCETAPLVIFAFKRRLRVLKIRFSLT